LTESSTDGSLIFPAASVSVAEKVVVPFERNTTRLALPEEATIPDIFNELYDRLYTDCDSPNIVIVALGFVITLFDVNNIGADGFTLSTIMGTILEFTLVFPALSVKLA
jgi:hypothetical protein